MLVMKKILSVIAAALICVLVFCGCEKSDTNRAQSGAQTSTEESNGESGEQSDKPVLMSGDYVELDIQENIRPMAVAEANGAIIFCTEDGNVYVFDAKSGERRYTFEAENIHRIVSADDREGFDYRVMTASAVLYRNSADPNAKFDLVLPECVAKCEETRPYDAHFYYDVLGDKIVYAADDGIYTCNTDGSEEHLLVPNANLPAYGEYYAGMGDDATTEPSVANLPLTYVCPKFACDGKRVAVKVFSPMDGMCAGFAVFDSETGEEIFLKKAFMDANFQYPVLGDCVAYKVHLTAEIYSMETGEKVSEVKAQDYFRTADYNKLVCETYDPTVVTDTNYKGLEIYAFSTDGSGRLMNKVNLGADAYITALTENYALVYVEYGAKVYLCAVEME